MALQTSPWQGTIFREMATHCTLSWRSRSPHGKGQFLGKWAPIVKYRDCLPWAVQKWLNRLICHLASGLGWAKGSTGSIVFARWHQCAQAQLYSAGGANVPNDTLPWAVQKWLNRLIYRLGYGLGWAEWITSSIMGGHIGATWRIWLNSPSAAATWLCVKLLWLRVNIDIIINSDSGVVIYLERHAHDLHMVQLMPLPPHRLLLH